MSDWKPLYNGAKAFSKYLKANTTPENLFTEDFLIPSELYLSTRGNIEAICFQINRAYEVEIFDGAAVLIRKVIEILLILCFKLHGIENTIKDADGNYLELSRIVKAAVQNKQIDLSRNAKDYLEIFREKGNLSAHNPFHLCTKKDLERLQPKIRHLFQELLFKAGIRK